MQNTNSPVSGMTCNSVQRFLLKACPTELHPKYYKWTIAELCILIGDDSNPLAFEKAKQLIRQNHWTPISSIHRSTLKEDLILQQDETMILEYMKAKAGVPFFQATTNNWTGFKNRPLLLFPKITESFIDKVVESAGGRRFAYDEELQQRNADYLIDDYIFELKLVEEERLIYDTVQHKLADLLYQLGQSDIKIDGDELEARDYSLYTNIFRTPIQNAVKSASKQIASTKSLLGNDDLRGGLIIINNGTSSITPKVFHDCIIKSLSNHETNINTYVSVSNWCETDGFNTSYNFAYNPRQPNLMASKLIDAFRSYTHDFLTDWMRYGMTQDASGLQPLQVIAYEKYGIVFSSPGTFDREDIT